MTETGFGMIWNKENVQDDCPENNEAEFGKLDFL